MSLGAKLRKLRSQTKYSQQDMADMLNIDRKTYAHWESEKCNKIVECLPKIAIFFGVTIDELFEEETETAESAVSERK